MYQNSIYKPFLFYVGKQKSRLKIKKYKFFCDFLLILFGRLEELCYICNVIKKQRH